MKQDIKRQKEEAKENQKEKQTESQKEEQKEEQKESQKEEQKNVPSGRKRRLKKWVRWTLLGSGMGALVAAYVTIAVYYQSHFLPNTEIQGVDCSNADAIAVETEILQQSREYTLEITGRDEQGNRQIIGLLHADDIDYVLADMEGAVKSSLDQQNSWLWIIRFFDDTWYSYDFALGVAFDENKMADALQKMDACQKKNMIKPQNAYISEYLEAVQGYEIVPETMGTQLDMDAVQSVVAAAVYGNAESVDLGEQGCYVEAAVTARDPELLANLADANKWLGAKITYDWNGSKVVVNIQQIREWITIRDNKPSLDEEAVAEFVAEQAKTYDTYGKRRNFVTVLGTELSLPGGAYGWKTDREAETEELIKLIESGKSTEREPAYISKGAAKGSNDIGSSYVEVDMTNQHLYLYQNGNVVLETDFVSGNMSNGCTTPPGVFGITYKTTNAVLRGADYVTPVNYWMPFNGNIGMHDATWRTEFGGEIYLTNGSHGCINLPLDMAAAIYSYMSEGFPVICYYY